MRKIILTISVMALPLAACGKEETAPPDVDPNQPEVEELAPPATTDGSEPVAAEPDPDATAKADGETVTE